MKTIKNIIVEGKHNKPIITDVFYNENNKPKKIIIFCHGYKGFKDWGAWNLMAKMFANEGFFFVKFNFSHNGGTVQQPLDFPDLNAFGNNNYTKELDDLESIINWVYNASNFKNEVDKNDISLIGHSRGGGIVLLKANEEVRVKKIITLAAVSDFDSRSSTIGDLENWKKTGVKYVVNGRTKQQMPHFYQFYENFIQHKKRLNIKKAVENINIALLIIHGDNDAAISIEEAKKIHSWNSKSQLEIIKKADHVFNTFHPWEQKKMSNELEVVVKHCIHFLF